MTRKRDITGRAKFFTWLDTHRNLIETTPDGYIDKIIVMYMGDSDITLTKSQVSRWLRVYRVNNHLTIKRLTPSYLHKKSKYKSNYEDLPVEKDGLLLKSIVEDGE